MPVGQKKTVNEIRLYAMNANYILIERQPLFDVSELFWKIV